jgi:hypothetical protein
MKEFWGYNGFSMGKIEELQACAASLESLSDTPCHYAHECTDRLMAVQCPEARQEQCLGCAHSELVVLSMAMTTLKCHDLLSSERATVLAENLDKTFVAAIRLDIAAAADYEEAGVISSQTMEEERVLIQQRADIRDELLRWITHHPTLPLQYPLP